jgi:hypothetical protein
MTDLNDLINKHIDSIRFNGCQLSKEMLTLMFQGAVNLAKLNEAIESNQRFLDSLPTAFGNGGNDQVNAIGQHITEPEFIQPNEMVKGNWYHQTDEDEDEDGYKYLLKFDRIEKGHVFVFEAFHIGDQFRYQLTSSFCTDDNLPNLRPATIEEVTKYFPNEFISEITEHPNKY